GRADPIRLSGPKMAARRTIAAVPRANTTAGFFMDAPRRSWVAGKAAIVVGGMVRHKACRPFGSGAARSAGLLACPASTDLASYVGATQVRRPPACSASTDLARYVGATQVRRPPACSASLSACVVRV